MTPAKTAARDSATSRNGRRLAFHGLVGASPGMQDVYRRLEVFAPARIPVLIAGETGTGKNLCARAMHAVAGSDEPFVDVNCAALADDLVRSALFGHREGAFTGATSDRDGLLARADGGTLFLDEIGDLPSDAQSLLLKALETGTYRAVGGGAPVTSDFRLVAATHRDLEAMVEAGEFRSDLQHRLGVARVELPPLRQRTGDVALLAREFLRRAGDDARQSPAAFSEEALEALRAFRWPGNVRQLQQVVDAAALLADGQPVVRASHVREFLPDSEAKNEAVPNPTLELETVLERAERRTIRAALERSGGHRARTAELLGISESTLYRKLPLEGTVTSDHER